MASISIQRTHDTTKNIAHELLAVTPASKTVSAVLPGRGAKILDILGFLVFGYSIGSTTGHDDATRLWNSESLLVPPAAEPGALGTASSSLAPCIAGILETGMM